MWAGLIRIIRTMVEARSVKWKTMKKKSFILLPPDADSLRHDADSLRHDDIAKDAFIDALEYKELTLRVMERAQNFSRKSSRLQKG